MIRKAIIPAAGMGTRFLPITKTQPKEMLPVVNKPVIQYVIEEAYGAGIQQMLCITGKHKGAIEDYLDKYDLKTDNASLAEFETILETIKIYYTRQKVPAGLGDAIKYAADFVDGDPFAVLLGDNITIPNCTFELIKVYEKYNSPIIAIEMVSPEKIKNHGIVLGDKIEEGVYKITDMIEKPYEQPSNLAIIGRYILIPELFDYLSKVQKGFGGEIQLTDALRSMVLDGYDIYAVLHRGQRFDIGNNMDWLKANIELGYQHSDIGQELKDWLFTKLKEEQEAKIE